MTKSKMIEEMRPFFSAFNLTPRTYLTFLEKCLEVEQGKLPALHQEQRHLRGKVRKVTAEIRKYTRMTRQVKAELKDMENE